MLARTALIAVVATLVLAGCSGDDDSDTTAKDTSPTSGVSCDYEQDGQPPAKEVDPPSGTATETGEVTATMTTSAGDLGLTLDADATPCTVHSFVSLAEQGYFDDTPCHRLTTSGIHVLQCGDPSGSGMGGPGYSYADELTGSEQYPAGTLAMANAGPDTNGSQFFVVYGETQLDPDYTVFGTIDDAGLAVVEEIAAAGTADGGPDGAPVEPVTIESVTID